MPAGNQWYKLDNAAKMIPPTSHGSDTRVFRLVSELREEVDPDILQRALDRAIQDFPHFNCYMKKGFFWYYLELCRERAYVSEDHLPALSPLYIKGRKNLLYRVTYFHRRINLEMYHALSDGTGAFQFLRQIVIYYLMEKHGIERFPEEESRASISEKVDDAFDHFYTKGERQSALKSIGSMRRKAYQLKGEMDENLNVHLLEGMVPVRDFLQISRKHHTTLAILTTSVMIEAIIKEMNSREKRMPVVVTVPVNLRNYFPSETTRNFYGVISIIYLPEKYDGTLESIIPDVEASFQDQLQEDRIRKTMNSYAALEHNWAVRIVPLQLKDLGISGINSRRVLQVTTSVSNVGLVKMPEEVAPYIERFCSFMSTRNTQVCISSYGDQLVFGFTSAFRRHPVVMNFFRRLTDMGLEVELATNDYDRQRSGPEDA